MPDFVVPFSWYKRGIFNQPEAVNGMSFIYFPFDGVHPIDAVKLAESTQDEYYREVLFETRACGYVLVPYHIIQLIENVRYEAGGDGRSDAIASYQVAFCYYNATLVRRF